MTVDRLAMVALVLVNLALAPYFVFLLATSLAALASRRARRSSEDPRSRFLIVIPAHDEESGIKTTVRSCLAADYPSSLFGVLVIADNCSDRTAYLAAEAGARVVERFDSLKKSKGYAIEYLMESLELSGEFDAFDALVIIDADTTMDADLLRYFDQGLQEGRDWIQCYYTVANPDQSWRTRLMTYAFSLFNGVMLLGQNRLGASAGFKGNGMCLTTRGLRRRPWRSYGLVEDMEYSWTLRIMGEKIAFAPEVAVHGAMLGSGGAAAANQRRRWEFGRGDIRKKYLGPLLRSNRISWWEKAVSACELTIPSMGGLALLYVIVLVLNTVAWFANGTYLPPVARGFLLASCILMTASMVAYGISPFVVMRLPWRYAWSIALFPVYLIWKLLISLKGRPQQWVRTARESQREGPRNFRDRVSASRKLGE